MTRAEVILWAKGRRTKPRPTIGVHDADVLSAGEAVWDSIEADLAASLESNPSELRRCLHSLYRCACLLHDVGKANSAFLGMLEGSPYLQPVHHELLSMALVGSPGYCGGWFRELLGDRGRWTLAWAIGGHHLRLHPRRDGDRGDPIYSTAGVARTVTLHFGHDEVAGLVRKCGEILAAPTALSPPVLDDRTFDTIDEDDGSLRDGMARLVRESRLQWADFAKTPGHKVDLALLKALLIAADVAGAALPTGGTPLTDWIRSALSLRLCPGDLDPVIQANLKGRPARAFQERVEQSGSAAIVMAGCGNGKTTAAYMWARRWAQGRKLFFCYPTTGTASAGFADYLVAQTDLERALIHSRASVDLRAMQPSLDVNPSEEFLRLESLQAWPQKIIACTVDTVLGLIQNQRRPLFSFPAIACGAFVFDEIHNYDSRLFGELLVLLRTFPGAPVLLMSASIPPARLAKLREVLGARLSAVVTGDPNLEKTRRYRLERRLLAPDCWPEVKAVLGRPANNKVLWVCNTVDDAMRVYEDTKRVGVGARRLLFHSRYLYKDRVARQNQVISAFRASDPEPVLVIATQVCEVSLNVSANLMVTARAPLPAMVQRLGRLNRFAEEDDPWPCLVYDFEGRPYDEPEDLLQMAATDKALDTFGGKAVGQADLAECINRMQGTEEPGDSSAWLGGGWESEPLPAREGETAFTVIREEDLAEIAEHVGTASPDRWRNRDVIPWTVPMPLRGGVDFVRRAGGYPVAPRGSILYDLEAGARWAR